MEFTSTAYMRPFQNVYDRSLGQKVMQFDIKFEVSYLVTCTL